jgi:hypothetical protein
MAKIEPLKPLKRLFVSGREREGYSIGNMHDRYNGSNDYRKTTEKDKANFDPARVMEMLGEEDRRIIDLMVTANNVGDEESYRKHKDAWLYGDEDDAVETDVVSDLFLDDPAKFFNESLQEVTAEFMNQVSSDEQEEDTDGDRE